MWCLDYDGSIVTGKTHYTRRCLCTPDKTPGKSHACAHQTKRQVEVMLVLPMQYHALCASEGWFVLVNMESKPYEETFVLPRLLLQLQSQASPCCEGDTRVTRP